MQGKGRTLLFWQSYATLSRDQFTIEVFRACLLSGYRVMAPLMCCSITIPKITITNQVTSRHCVDDNSSFPFCDASIAAIQQSL